MFRRWYVYLRIIVVLAVVMAIVVVLVMNRSHRVAFWFFGLTDPEKQVNAVWLVLSTCGATLIISRVAALGLRLWRDWRKLKSEDAARAVAAVQQQREFELNERERRLTEKLQEAVQKVGENDSAG